MFFTWSMECYIGCRCWVTSSLPDNKSRMNSRLLTKRLHSRILQEALCDPPFLLPRPLAPVVPWLLCMFRFELLAFPPQLPASQAVLVPRPWAPQSWAQLARLSAHLPQTWQQINLMNRYIWGRPGPWIWLGWGRRCQVLFWSKADAGFPSGRCQHLAAALCTGVQPRVHHRRVGSHRKSLVLFQIRSGRWRRHKKVAEVGSRTASSL